MEKRVALIGYSGHAFVAADILLAMGKKLGGYFDISPKNLNPYALDYLGNEHEGGPHLHQMDYFIGIGDNQTRARLHQTLSSDYISPLTIVHPRSWVSSHARLEEGVMVSAHATINAMARIGRGVICNTACIIEHDCELGEFVHIAPGAVLGGNVKIGKGSLIGAGAVIKPGIHIGEHVTIGAGAVIVKPVPKEKVVIGNPQRFL